MPICVVGDPQDLSAVYIAWLARRRGIEVVELCEDKLGIGWAFEFDDGRRRDGRIRVGNVDYPFSELGGAFVRLNSQPALPPGLDLTPEQQHAFVAERRAGIHQLLQCLPCVVANRSSSGRSNGSKPYQMRLLANAGFEVPEWIVSNDETTVRSFARTCIEGTIYKSCTGLRSRVRRLDDEVLRRLRQGSSPIVVQEYIMGRDVRVHTVGHHAFATEVIGEGVDYRFEHEGSEYRPTTVPDQILRLCCKVAESEGLTIAGFDFRVTDDGLWYCLEVNPVPTFLPYEMSTGQPIGDALLDVFAPVKAL